MSRLFPNSEAKWNGSKRPSPAAANDTEPEMTSLEDQALPEERRFRPGESAFPELGLEDEAVDLDQLKLQNIRLRSQLGQLEKQTEEFQEQLEQSQKEFDSLLEEKSEVIRSLHRKIQDLQEGGGGRGGEAQPGEQELLALSEELERERLQLKEDEEALMKQMRDMEVQMAKERADIARQRHEVTRLHSELRHELDIAGRDTALRDRLAPLQRRHQELSSRRGSAPPPPDPPPTASQPPPSSAPKETPPPRKESFFGRLFGQ